MRVSVTASITAQNTYTSWAHLTGTFQLLISGLTDSTVTFQGTPDLGSTIYDIDTFVAATGNTLHVGNVANSDWTYRAGVKTGNYGTDTVVLRLEA